MLKRLWPALIFTMFVGGAIAGIVYQSTAGTVVAIAIAAILLNGLVATVEDNMPGGFNNPDGRVSPRSSRMVAWAVRVLGGSSF
jgi:hypothetical protein